MKKKLLGVVLLVMSLVFLVACGQKESMDGTYYHFYDVKGKVLISELYPVKVSGTTLIGPYNNDKYDVNFDNKTLIGEDDIFEYEFKNGVLSFNENDYVKKDSSKYEELVKEGAEVKK